MTKEELILFKKGIARLADNISNGNQLAVMQNGALIVIADYDEKFNDLLESLFDYLIRGIEQNI